MGSTEDARAQAFIVGVLTWKTSTPLPPPIIKIQTCARSILSMALSSRASCGAVTCKREGHTSAKTLYDAKASFAINYKAAMRLELPRNRKRSAGHTQ
jgi:hypothetical protein